MNIAPLALPNHISCTTIWQLCPWLRLVPIFHVLAMSLNALSLIITLIFMQILRIVCIYLALVNLAPKGLAHLERIKRNYHQPEMEFKVRKPEIALKESKIDPTPLRY